MGVPSFQQLMLPALQTIGQRYDEISISGLEDEVSKVLKISVEERQLRLPSRSYSRGIVFEAGERGVKV
jgi:hypothetical protein